MLDASLPNVGADLQRIHRVISRGLSVLQEKAQTYGDGGFPDSLTSEGFWKFCHGLEANLHGHHLTEEDIFFPFLKDRLPQLDLKVLYLEHEQVLGILAQVKAAREAGSLLALQRALASLVTLWRAHIGKEEVWFSPQVLAGVCSVPEHIDLAQRAAAHSQQHAQPAPLAVPFLLYNVDGDDRAFFMRVMPAELTQHLVPVVWKDEWAAMKPFLLP